MRVFGYIDLDVILEQELDLEVEPVVTEEKNWTQLPLFENDPPGYGDNRQPVEEEYFRKEAQAKTDMAVLMQQEILALKQAYEEVQHELAETRKFLQQALYGGQLLFEENQQLKRVLGPLMRTPSVLNQPLVDQHGQPVAQTIQQAAQPGTPMQIAPQGPTTSGFGPTGKVMPF